MKKEFTCEVCETKFDSEALCAVHEGVCKKRMEAAQQITSMMDELISSLKGTKFKVILYCSESRKRFTAFPYSAHFNSAENLMHLYCSEIKGIKND